MVDPLAEVVALLEPHAPLSKVVTGAGSWRLDRTVSGHPFYCVLVEGSCRLLVDGAEPITLIQGDFVLIPSVYAFTMSSLDGTAAAAPPHALADGEFRLGNPDIEPDIRLLVGHCRFGSPDTALLVSLLPRLVHVRGEARLSTMVGLIVDEYRRDRPARDAILAKLLEILMLEAFRFAPGNHDAPSIVRGLADERLAIALRKIHESPDAPWTVPKLAQESAMSRSTFYDRFTRIVGIAPMEYLFVVRMALAKTLLRKGNGIAEVAERVGYGSASAFSTAFTRHVGLPPARYARDLQSTAGPVGTMSASFMIGAG